jgi:hypothetical protein
MDLQDTFYILGIVYMSLMLLIMLALVIAVFIIKRKVNEIHRKIDEKLAIVNNIAHLGSDIVGAAKKVVGKK